MALPAAISALTDELIQIIANTPDKTSHAFRRSRVLVDRTLKQNKSGSTDHHAVARRLDGLQEKFQILNNDVLSDALHSRLQELDQRRSHWTPEILSFFLELSDNPVKHSRVKDLQLLRPASAAPSLTWSDINASSPIDEEEGLWGNVDFGADTSDEDDLVSLSSDVSIPKIVPQRPTSPIKDYTPPEDLFVASEDENLLSSIKAGESWRHELNGVNLSAKDHTLPITELQVVREALFMLQGLPSSVFWKVDNSIVVDRRFSLQHASAATFGALLESFSTLGSQTHLLRNFAQKPQRIQFLQTFRLEIEHKISGFDRYLSSLQATFATTAASPIVSLIQLYSDVTRESSFLMQLAELVSKLNFDSSQNTFQCLDLLYDLVCLKQASGEDKDFRQAARIFINCFEIYTKPLRLWMETGQLDSTIGAFFVSDRKKSNDLKTLWSEWFALEALSDQLYAPKFLHPAAKKIFTTGKSMIFLHHLGIPPGSLEFAKAPSITYEDLCPPEPSSLLLPFSALLESSFDRLVNTNHSVASSLLREQLDEQCGLWTSLDALEHIYLGKDLSLSVHVDHRIFELLDKRRQVWNDRFILTELTQETFSTLHCVDGTRLITRTKQIHPHEFDRQCRSVKILKAICVDYVLPWPVANVITKEALSTYQRVWTLLLQIRRAKFVLERQRLLKLSSSSSTAITHTNDKDDILGYSIRHYLLWFLNVLYSHLTERVIASSTAEMRKSLAKASDVDRMISAHQQFTSTLEDQCLLSTNLSPIYQAVISLLDLCIHFSDIQTSRHGEHLLDQGNRSLNSSTGQRSARTHRAHARRRRRRRAHSETSASDADDDNDDDDDSVYSDVEMDEDEGNTTCISFIESPYRQRLIDTKDTFDRLCSFIVSGLRGVGRVDGQQSWEALAEKLEWRRSRVGYG
ncbi:hypothetical protein AJ80_08422 [Polytolypa hystricis UAMH7299]|uniref:Spindle pole body component n=1 Tax=Polytolypa hystricis (strain UAMH7299) TaxID=1447883 RepID=A0A2B7X7Q1_POLH7|nr:hypothetical protein AJ80_08422 [Polytolypa hystricis UAMH7299]